MNIRLQEEQKVFTTSYVPYREITSNYNYNSNVSPNEGFERFNQVLS